MSPPDSATLQAFPLGHDATHPHQQDLMDDMDHSNPHFSEFDFPTYADIQEASVVSLADAHGTDMFCTHPPQAAAAVHERTNSVISQGPAFNVAVANRRRHSMAKSEDGSENSHQRVLNPLEDTLSDEFGISGTGPVDGTDLGGKPKEDKAELAPAWSELKTKAGKERKRLPLACIACRRKKIRCSGEKPACKHCLRSRIPCVYKVTTRKAAPRTDYMAMLDKRLKRMEERILKIIPKAEQETASSGVTRAVVKPAIPGTVPANKAPKKRQAEDNDLDQWAARPQSKARLNGTNRPVALQVQEAEDSKLLVEGAEALPDKMMQEHLAEVFFENIYGQAYHLLHKPSYMRKLKNGTLPPVLILSVCAIAARFSTHPKLGSTPNFLRGEEWASEAREIVTRRYEWPNMTILTCLLILGLHEFGTCQGGRSWALGGQATRMAFALQLHKDLEYDPVSSDGTTQLSFIDREIRRRTMWACFLMDRFTSSGSDRPMFIREQTLKIQLPIKEKYFQLDMPGPTETLDGQVDNADAADDGELANAKDNMGVAAYMIRSVALWGRIINYLNQGGRESDPHPLWKPESGFAPLLAQAEELVKTLPESLLYTEENLRLHDTENMANQFLFLHISIQQNILFVNRHLMSTPELVGDPDVPPAYISQAQETSFTAANRISDLLKDAETFFVAAPFVGYCAFLSSTVHIIGLYSKGGGDSQLAERQKKNLAINIKFLGKMKRYWGMFHWTVETLREQYKTYHDATRATPPGTNPTSAVGGPGSLGSGGDAGTPTAVTSQSPIFQYGDWFDRYPHGLSHSDFLDPAIPKKKEKGDDAVLGQKPDHHTVEEFFTTLSPPQSDNVHAGLHDPRATGHVSLKRKSALGGAGVGSGSVQKKAREHPTLDPLLTDLAPHAHLTHQARLRGYVTNALGGQTSGPTPFNPLTSIPHTTGPAYHALSPISPVVGHHGSPFALPGTAAAHAHALTHYPPELLNALGANVPPSAGMVGHMDRQMVFGAYAGQASHGGAAGHHGHGHNPMDGGWDSNGMPSRRNTTGGSGGGGGGGGGGGRVNPGTAGFATDSSAWFMPFNLEPPDLGNGADMMGGGGMNDGFNVFGGGGNGGGGMSMPGGGMGLHHAH